MFQLGSALVEMSPQTGVVDAHIVPPELVSEISTRKVKVQGQDPNRGVDELQVMVAPVDKHEPIVTRLVSSEVRMYLWILADCAF